MTTTVQAPGLRARSPRRRAVVRALGAVLTGLVLWTFWPQALGGATQHVIVSGESMVPTLRPGDLVLLRSDLDTRPDDVVAFRPPQGELGRESLVIHRLVSGSAETGFTARGDNNTAVDPWLVASDDVVGRQWFVVPGLGGVLAWLRSPLILGAAAGLAGAYYTLTWSPPRPARRGSRSPGRTNRTGPPG